MRADARIEALRARLAEEGLDAFAIIEPVNVAYLTGFEGVFDAEPAHIAFIAAEELVLFTDGRYSEAAKAAGRDTDWKVEVPQESLLEEVCARADQLGLRNVGTEDSLPFRRFEALSKCLDGELRACAGWVEQIREVKTSEEIERITAAQALTDECFAHALEFIAVGRTEREIALELEYFMRRRGSEGVAFPPIVASGPNSALPHAKPTDRQLSRGDFVKLDFGARVEGYCADMTRTVVLGEAGDRQREVYEAVLAANRAAIAATKTGAVASAVHAAAKDELEARGLGNLFTHGVGHGVGMDVHELPRVGPRANEPLREDAVITIEPGVYEPGVGGVRIEDLVVVRESGARVLTRSPKDLIEL